MNKVIEAEEEEIVEGQEPEAPEDQEDVSEDSEGAEAAKSDSDKPEIVLDGDSGSQPKRSNAGIRKRIRELKAKQSEAERGQSLAKESEVQANSELAIERQKNELLRMALEQQKEVAPSSPPDPLDYDGGAGDPKYKASMNEYIGGIVKAETAKNVAPAAPKVGESFEVAQIRHYQAAEKLNHSDYNDMEDVVIEIFGSDIVNELIKASPDSAAIMYHLGENPDKAEEIAELIKENPILGTMAIGALNIKPRINKAKRNQAPNPDDELEGATPVGRNNPGPPGVVFT